MRCTEQGVLPGSEYFFATPSQQAKSLLYYLLSVGRFLCGPDYQVRRERHDSVLAALVEAGACTVETEGRRLTAGSGQLILLDCRRPHAYGAAGPGLRLLWAHFDGAQSREFARRLEQGRGIAARCPREAGLLLEQLYTSFRAGRRYGEPETSCLLHQLLCGLLPDAGGREEGEAPRAVAKAIRFLEGHFDQAVTVEEAARAASMSASHLSRLFRRQTGSSPHEYLTQLRLDQAKRLLKSTDQPVGEVALLCGFETASGFINAFRAHTGMSPGRFRETPL